MSAPDSTTSVGFNPAASVEKLDAWNENKHKNLRDTILKVVAIVALVLFGFGALAASIAVPVVLPIIPAALIVASLPLGVLSFIVSNCTAMFVGCRDWTDYRNPDNVVKKLKDLKEAQFPRPIYIYKHLHRYGIISNDELNKRVELEASCHKYQQTVRELNNKTRLILSTREEIKRLTLMPSMATRKSDLEKEVEKMEARVGELDDQKVDLQREFDAFHTSIAEFDPTQTSE